MTMRVRLLMVGFVWIYSRRDGRAAVLAPSRTLCAAGAVAQRQAILDRRCARRHWLCAAREGRCRSNKRMGLPDAASRTLYRIRQAERTSSSATITVMKKISFRSILLRPSYCARLIRSHDFKCPLFPLRSAHSLSNFDDRNKPKTVANG
jgi:hypothetical protein